MLCNAELADFFYDGEYFVTTEETGFRYSPSERCQKAIAYLEKYHGLPKQKSGSNSTEIAPVLYFEEGGEFDLECLDEVCCFIPFEDPEEHSLIITGPSGTLFAFGNGQLSFAPGYYLKVANN